MAITQLAPPYPIFTDRDGSPLDAGYLYFGEPNLNPETNPIQVYYDPGLTQPLAQPIRTSNGYVMRNGSPALIYADGQFSITVRNKKNELVIYSPVGFGITPSVPFATFENAARDVSALLTGTQFTYLPDIPNTIQVVPGYILRTLAEGFAYDVAASTATDQHVTTAGGVKLYVQPIGAGQYGGIWPLAALGLDFTGTTNEAAKIQRLMDTASAAGGGQLFHPGGTILCTGIIGKAGVGLLGVGPKSLFNRAQTSNNMINWNGADATNICIQNCAFDLNTIANPLAPLPNVGGAGDFVTCVRLDDFRKDGTIEFQDNNVFVTGCHFFNSNKATTGNWTLSALQLRGINGFTVANNSADGVQFKLGGADANTINAQIVNNRFFESQAYCISVVVRGDGSTHLRNVNIDGNVMEGFSRGAIFVGFDDGTGGSLVMENVVIQNNVCKATTFGGVNKDGVFIIYRMSSSGGLGGYVIQNNTFIVPVGYNGSSSNGLIFTDGGGGDDRLIVKDNIFEVRGSIERILGLGSRVHFINNTAFGQIGRIANSASETSIFRGNRFDGKTVGELRIIYNSAATFVDVQNNEWVNCPRPVAFDNGLIFTSPSAGVSLTGIVARNVVRSPDVFTEAFIAERPGSGSTSIIYTGNEIGAGIKFFDVRQSPVENLKDNIVAVDYYVRRPAELIQGASAQSPLSVDPANPAVGESVTWVSDGTGAGDPGDVMMKINVGGVTKTITLVDYSAA